jgi:hypothetical protein
VTLALTHVHPHRAAAVLGALVLSEAPRYGASTHTAAFHSAPAALGSLLILPGLQRLLTRSRKDMPTPTVAQRRRRAWRTWGTLLATSTLFAVATAVGAGIHILAPLTLCTVGLFVAVVWTSTWLAVAMLRQDHTGPLLRLRWLTVTPGCLLGLILAYILSGDTWATLLFGCFATGLGTLLCDLWAPVPPGSNSASRQRSSAMRSSISCEKRP